MIYSTSSIQMLVVSWCTIPLACTTCGCVVYGTTVLPVLPLPYSVHHGVLVERYSEGIYSGTIHGSIHGSDLPKTSSGHTLTSSASHAVGGGVGGGVVLHVDVHPYLALRTWSYSPLLLIER